MLAVRHNLRGFSLIELMVGLAILAVLMGIAAPSFRTWIQNTQLSSAAESISAGLQQARAEAVRRNTDVQFTLASATSGNWTVGCVTPVADLDGDGQPDCPATIQSQQVSAESPHAEINANLVNVAFSGLGRASNAITITIENSSGGTCRAAGGPMRCLNVLVATGGQIRMCNPAYPRTNPQGC